MSYVTPLGEDSWKLVPAFFWTLPQVLFPLLTGGREHKEACARISLDSTCFFFFLLILSCIYPFTVINLSYEFNYMLKSVSPTMESPKLGMVLGTPDTNMRTYTHAHTEREGRTEREGERERKGDRERKRKRQRMIKERWQNVNIGTSE